MSVTNVESQAGPVTLVVEDNPKLLKARKALFDEVGFYTIGVLSYEDALREMRSGPGVDLVITDINLDPGEKENRLGVDLARVIRDMVPSPPVIGYSAKFNEEDLTPGEVSLFRDLLPKARLGPNELLKRAGEWLEIANQYRASRAQFVAQELERLRQKYEMRERDFEILRSFIPDASFRSVSSEPESADEILHRAGYRARFIEPGMSRPKIGGEASKVLAPILVWMRSEGGITVAEVAGFHELYEYGKDDEEAIQQLLLLMDGYYQDLKTDKNDSVRVIALREFLQHVFG